MNLWDTSGAEEYDSLRPLAFPGIDIFLICFSLVDPSSFEHIKTKWLQEIKDHIMEDSKPVFVLVGTKLDLRSDSNIINSFIK